jgi:hypothetical protein
VKQTFAAACNLLQLSTTATLAFTARLRWLFAVFSPGVQSMQGGTCQTTSSRKHKQKHSASVNAGHTDDRSWQNTASHSLLSFTIHGLLLHSAQYRMYVAGNNSIAQWPCRKLQQSR